MSKQLVSGKHRLRNTYWSLVGAASATILSVQPVMAETIWDRFSTIMRDIYGQLVGISTIVAVTVAAIALLVRMVSRNQRAVDEATSWLKRVVVTWIMQQHAEAPAFEQGEAAGAYNQAAFRNFMPGFEQQVAHVDGTHREDGHFEVRHTDGSGTAFYDTARFAAPRGDYQVYEDVRGQQWIAIHGDPAVERKPVFEDGKPVYDGENVRTVSVESVRYKNTPSRFKEPEKRPDSGIKAPKRRK